MFRWLQAGRSRRRACPDAAAVTLMPSPIGHAIAGAATVWLADLVRGPHDTRPSPTRAETSPPGLSRWITASALAGAALAMTPDLDYLAGAHRLQTHSLGAAILVAAVVWLVVRARGGPAVVAALTAGASYGSHLLLDWLNGDSGVMLFWPLTSSMHSAPVEMFLMPTFEYWHPVRFLLVNTLYVGWEVVVIGTPAVVIGWLRTRALMRGPSARRATRARDVTELDLRPSLD